MQWLTPVILALLGWGVDHLRSGVRDQPGQHSETPSLLKLQKISQAWWWLPVIPATQEYEAEELLELRRRRLQQAKIAPLHSSLATEQVSISKKRKESKHTHSHKLTSTHTQYILMDKSAEVQLPAQLLFLSVL